MSTILVVEDNEPSRDALSRRLELRGYRVAVAVDAIEGVAVARATQPDLILMDLGSTGDGWQATRRLKSDRSAMHVPIVVLSARAMIGHRVRFQQLLDRIESLLAKAPVS